MVQYNENIKYEILEDGYNIYRNENGEDKIWISQRGDYSKPIDSQKSFEENCIAQLEQITAAVAPTEPEPTIAELKTKVDTLENDLTNTQLALTEQYEENLALQDEVTNTQLALTEIYEAMP